MELPAKKNGHYLSIEYNNEFDAVTVVGSKEGLDYLARICNILSENIESEHIHLSFAMGMLEKGSVDEFVVQKKK